MYGVCHAAKILFINGNVARVFLVVSPFAKFRRLCPGASARSPCSFQPAARSGAARCADHRRPDRRLRSQLAFAGDQRRRWQRAPVHRRTDRQDPRAKKWTTAGNAVPRPDHPAELLRERGLLGLAFHPNYATNGFFYVDYTRALDGATVIARYSVSANPDLANPASASVLLTIAQPFSNHNGGQLAFGPLDGYLYVGMGDGGDAGDPQNNAQNINSLLGKLLRLDVDHGVPYSNPPDNPYVGIAGADQIWAIGLRNPWRFSFDRQTGDLYIGDVGQGLWEEIDFQAANTPGGLNFGWRCREGNHDYNFTGDCTSLSLVPAIAEYSHTVGHSVTGGFVYRGQRFPALQSRYFYADYVNGQIWSLYQSETNPLTWSTPELELDTSLNFSSFGEDENGELYIVDYSGKVRRLADVNALDRHFLPAILKN